MNDSEKLPSSANTFRQKLFDIIFESESIAGKLFDLILILFIVLSGIVVMLDSVDSIKEVWENQLFRLDWFFTIIFTIEYFCRIYAVEQRKAYIFSFYGLIDFFAIFPAYLSLLVPGAQYFSLIRLFRAIRIFRILKLAHYMDEANLLMNALNASRRRISVFVFGVLLLVSFLGALMYVVEGPENGFKNIPLSIYWAVVTLTTVGYGDISPQTPLGQALSVVIMLMGYGIIAIPTGIVTSELVNSNGRVEGKVCSRCLLEGHDIDAVYCKQCGNKL